MAYTASFLVRGVSEGNMIMNILNVTADNTSGSVDTGLRNVVAALVTSKSAATNPNVMENALTAGTASAGQLSLSNCTSGNIYRVTVFGN